MTKMAAIAQRALRTPALMRAPIWAYRAGLGFVFGSRLLMLEHIGRRTGTKRYVVLEVLSHSSDAYVVASGFGDRSQWYRNVMAQPRVAVSVAGRCREPATARRLPGPEADQVLQDYIDHHRKAWSRLSEVLSDTLRGRAAPPGTELPLIELRLG